MKKIIIQQAYSTRNSGDGLLVDLTIELINESIENEDIQYVIFANDPESFTKYENTIQVDCVSSSPITKITHSLLNSLKLIKYKLSSQEFKYSLFDKHSSDACLIIGVGGGYMRGKNTIESLKCLINNTTQLLWAKNSRIPFIYFPQSIGPFYFKFHKNLVIESLKNSILTCCRDDRSLDICQFESAGRFPDLAVMKLAKEFSKENIKSSEKKPFKHLLVCRDIAAPTPIKNKYIEALKALKSIFDMEIVLQSTGRGNDDHSFCKNTFDISNFRTLKEALQDNSRHIVTSVRLHGSMETLLQGFPSVHLSYERKGFGAFSDLGLDNFVFNSFDLNVKEIEIALRKIESDESNYWQTINENIEAVIKRRENLKEVIKETIIKLEE